MKSFFFCFIHPKKGVFILGMQFQFFLPLMVFFLMIGVLQDWGRNHISILSYGAGKLITKS